jgi:transposase InsO family protein
VRRLTGAIEDQVGLAAQIQRLRRRGWRRGVNEEDLFCDFNIFQNRRAFKPRACRIGIALASRGRARSASPGRLSHRLGFSSDQRSYRAPVQDVQGDGIGYTWVLSSLGQIDHWCADFVTFYNRDRPHSSYGGLTPDEVAVGVTEPSPPRGRVTYFDDKMKWYAFG